MLDLLVEIIGEIVLEILWYSIYGTWNLILRKLPVQWNDKVLKVLCGILTIAFWLTIFIVAIIICEQVLP